MFRLFKSLHCFSSGTRFTYSRSSFCSLNFFGKYMFTFKKSKNILVVGDGDLSFSLSLAKENEIHHCNITATTFDSHKQLQKKYPNVQETIDKLNEHRNVEIFHEIDATNIQNTLLDAGKKDINEFKYDYIIWNFPHAGGKNFIGKNRILMDHFFISSNTVLFQKSSSRIFITLVCGQGGTDFEIINVPEHVQKLTKKPWKRNYGDHWQIVELGAKSNFFLSDIQFFDPPGEYKPRGYRDEILTAHKGFRTNFSVTHIFSLLLPLTKSEKKNVADVKCNLYLHFWNFFENQFLKCKDNINLPISCDFIYNDELNGKNLILREQNNFSFSLYSTLRIPDFPYSIPYNIPCNIKEICCIMDCKLGENNIHNILRSFLSEILRINQDNINLELNGEIIKLTVIRELKTIERKPGTNFTYFLGEIRKFQDNGNEYLKWTVGIEDILMAKYNIDDIRWFLSEDLSFFNSIVNALDKNEEFCFSPKSLFSSVISFDISFWLPEGKKFLTTEELGNAIGTWEYCEILRSMSLLEVYNAPSGKVSQCYRVEYQKIAASLHPSLVKEMQANLLDHFKTLLNITCRS